MTPEEHHAAGEEWLRKAERWDARVPGLSSWQAVVATAHFTAALYRPQPSTEVTVIEDCKSPCRSAGCPCRRRAAADGTQP